MHRTGGPATTSIWPSGKRERRPMMIEPSAPENRRRDGERACVLGNSHLLASLVAAYCDSAARERCWADWREMRVSRGSLAAPSGADLAYVACNMTLLGDPTLVDGSLTYSPALGAFLDCVNPEVTTIFVMLRGHEFAILSLVDTKPLWDFSYGARAALKGRQFVPMVDVSAYLDALMNPLLATCVLVKHKFPAAKIVHIAAPPPIQSETHILANPELFGPLFQEHGVRPFALRKKIYDALYESLSGRLRSFGIQTLFSPRECLTEDGGLNEKFAGGCLHGNDAYGHFLMAEMQRGFLDAPV